MLSRKAFVYALSCMFSVIINTNILAFSVTFCHSASKVQLLFVFCSVKAVKTNCSDGLRQCSTICCGPQCRRINTSQTWVLAAAHSVWRFARQLFHFITFDACFNRCRMSLFSLRGIILLYLTLTAATLFFFKLVISFSYKMKISGRHCQVRRCNRLKN